MLASFSSYTNLLISCIPHFEIYFLAQFTDLIEYTVSGRSQLPGTDDSKLPANLFDNLDEEERNAEG